MTVHGERCIGAITSISQLKDLKLIDCRRRRIVRPSQNFRYSALSYVWGSAKSHDDKLVNDDLPDVMPRTIEDAITVTEKLGLGFIWIDRYCIDQSNEAEKHNQIQQMDLLYQSAFITLIAAAGKDPHTGLPGVSTTLRKSQPNAWIGENHLFSILHDLKYLVRDSPWRERLWTYQEGFSSRRRLFFTEQQAYFDCHMGEASEAIDSVHGVPFRRSFSGASPIEIDNDSYRFNIVILYWCLRDYYGRLLSYEEDAIRAFEGVFHNFATRRRPVFHYFGIPILLVIEPLSGGDSESKNSIRSTSFTVRLSCVSTRVAKRRVQFPT